MMTESKLSLSKIKIALFAVENFVHKCFAQLLQAYEATDNY